MNLYLVTGTVSGYDTYEAFVCAAPDAEAARRMHPGGVVEWNDDSGKWENPACGTCRHRAERSTVRDWDPSIDTVTVSLIGKAAYKATEAGVILASFNAG